MVVSVAFPSLIVTAKRRLEKILVAMRACLSYFVGIWLFETFVDDVSFVSDERAVSL